MTEDKLSKEEIEAFRALKKTARLPLALENRIVSQLKSEGLIKEGSLAKVRRWGIVAAISILCFMAGMNFEQYRAINIDPQQGYMLVLFEDENFKVDKPRNIVADYIAWRDAIEESGVHIVGQELHNESAVVNQDSVIYLDNMSTKRLTGYFILEANSVDDVVHIAGSSPHVKNGGSIEIKEFKVR